MWSKIRKYMPFIIGVFIVCFCMVYNNYLCVTPIGEKKEKYGIIDGHLSQKYSCIYDSKNVKHVKKYTHGDSILEFLSAYSPDTEYYYYDAQEKKQYSSSVIIDGLEWMKDRKVKFVSISLSSKFYSEELQEWINANKNKVIVYASYNNELNTLDYPAGYKGVIGIGSSKKIKRKSNDVIFRTNRIVAFFNGIRYYEGNSYLTPYVMLRDSKK
ncbi:putative uncharacterized protein [Clostridium sp. CAG:411]|jgi:hypothetical protein|nr:S8 family serine peptidase [Lachnospiraceae bacterium]CDE42591.1 putative uncharacterized protein [Clostridium sp. CAG:411]